MIENKKKKSYLRNFHSLVFVFIICIFIVLAHSLNASQQNPNNKTSVQEPNRYKVFSFRHISSNKAVDYIKEAGLNVITQPLKENILSVSGQHIELDKATELLNLVDSTVPFVIERVAMPEQAGNSNMNKKLAAQTNGVSIGTFANPPVGEGAKAIVDVGETYILVVAPEDKASQIRFGFGAVEQLPVEPQVVEETGNELDANETVPEPDVLPMDINNVSEITAEEINQVDANLIQGMDAESHENTTIDTNTLVDVNTFDVNRVAVNALLRGDANTITKPEPNSTQLTDVFGKLVDSLSTEAETEPTIIPEANDVNTTVPVENRTQQPAVTKTFRQAALERGRPPVQTSPKTTNVSLEPTGITDSNEVLITLPERMNIIQLIQMVGAYLNLDYMYDPAKITGDITFSISLGRGGKIKVKELYPLMERALKFRGFVMTRSGNLVTIVPENEAQSIDPALVDATKPKIERGDIVITKVFHLKYIDAESAKNLLSGMGMGIDINTSASVAKIIIVTEYTYRMERVEQLLDMIDKPGEKKVFKFRQLKYTLASTMKDKIKDLADQLGTISITVAETAVTPVTPPATRGRPTVIRPPTRTPQVPPTTATEAESVYLDVDERTNRILMIGLPEQLDTVEGLIDVLDVQQQDLRSMRVYELKYADAADVVNKLAELNILSSTRATGVTRGRTPTTRTPRGATVPPQRITAGAAPGTSQTVSAGETESAITEPLAGEPQVIIIEITNSLLVNATAEQHEQIATVIAYLDTAPEEASTNYVVYPLENQDPEQLVEVLNKLIQETVESRDPTGKVVGTTTTRKTEEDITIIGDKNTFSVIVYASKRNQQWIESLIKQLDKRRPQVLIDVTLVEISKNDQFNLDLDLITKYPSITAVGSGQLGYVNTETLAIPDKRFWEARSNKGTGGAFYNDEHVQALLNAVIEKSYGRVLARPKLLVNDNESGTITTQVQTSIVSPKVTVIPGVSGGAPSSALDVSIVPYTSQIKLDIKPHISEGNLLRLEVTMNRTDFGELKNYDITVGSQSLKGPIPPDLLSSDVQTIITVPDQRTIILGGLEKLNQTKGGKKVPLLGDIPLLGAFFRSTSNTDNQSRLYLFVKANILRPEKEQGVSDIVRMSDKNRAEFEKYESEMQDYQDIPGIKSRPMEPRKILHENGTSEK